MLRFIHTADLHIGRNFTRFPEGVAVRLRAARVGAIERLGESAQTLGVRHVLIAGDMFDAAYVPAEDRRQAAAAMAEFPGIQWWIIPGNHDPAAAPVWDAWRAAPPPNTTLLETAAPVEMEPGVWLLPAPLSGAQQPGDPTRVLEGMATPEGSVRIALAHGSVGSFGSTADPNAIDTRRLARLGCSYVALGDWHGQKEVAEGVLYAGTPEPDGFGAQGRALVVDVDGIRSTHQSLESGQFSWHSSESVLLPDMVATDAARVVAEARPEGRARTALWRWRPTGRISPQGQAALQSAFAEAAPDFLHAQADWSGVLPLYSAADAAAMAPEGALRMGVEALMAQASAGTNPAAHRALSLLASVLKETI